RACDDAVFLPVSTEDLQVGVIAGPAWAKARLPHAMQMAHDVAIRIENANFRNGGRAQLFLAPRLSQQALGREPGRRDIVLAREDGRYLYCLFGHANNSNLSERREIAAN